MVLANEGGSFMGNLLFSPFALLLGLLAPIPALAQPPAVPTAVAEPMAPIEEVPWEPPPPNPAGLRGLPVCPPGAPATAPGQPYTCRPPYHTSGAALSFGMDLSMGVTDVDVPVHGMSVGIGVHGEGWLTRAFGLGLRYEYLTTGDAGRDADGDQVDDDDTTNINLHLLSAGPRLRLFTDETYREYWGLEAGAGYVIDHDGLSSNGPFLRLAVARELGALSDGGADLRVGLRLSAMQGVGSASGFRAVLLDFMWGFGLGVPEPLDLDEPEHGPGFGYTFGVDIAMATGYLGATSGSFNLGEGFGLVYGLRPFHWLEPRLRASIDYQARPDADGVTTIAGTAGLRIDLERWAPVFLEAMGGYAVTYGTELRPYDDGPVVDIAAGAHFTLCAFGMDFGLRYRHGLADDNEELRSLTFFVGLGHVGLTDRERVGSCGGSVPTAPTPPPPPAPLPPPSAGGSLDMNAGLDVDAHIEVPQVDVEVEVRPVIIEVTLGVALFGGAVQLNINPDSLPLDRLREAGILEVEIVGPIGALVRAEAEMRAVLDRSGLRARAVTHTASDRMDVRAIFTLWPPGSR